jgi:hypothetical protein
VLAHWQAAVAELATALGEPDLQVRVVIGRSGEPPRVPQDGTPSVVVEREPAEFRGTGGLLRDLARGYSPNDLILVGNGAQILVQSLVELTQQLTNTSSQVAIIAHRDGTPSGLFLVRCRVFESVADVGFLDFKEQLLPRLAAAGVAIRVVQRDLAAGYPVRTLDGYLSGLDALGRLKRGEAVVQDPFAEDWESTFSIVEPGATVDPSAVVHNSVVLSGATLQRGAAVVRCVVCPGAVVSAGLTYSDRVITADSTRRSA